MTSAELRRRLSAARDGLLGRIPTDSIGRFRRDGWNRLLLKDLQLNSDSVAFDVGGYRGDYTASLLELYGCRVHVFEPVGMFADHLDRRFGRDSRVMVHRAALGARAGTFQLDLREDATTASGIGGAGPTRVERSLSTPTVVSAQVMAIDELESLGIDRVDLMAMNIEGGEYDLITALADSGWLDRVDRFLVQFHDVSPTSRMDRERCHALLAETHACDWDYPFVWESWTQVGGGSVT